MEITACAYYSTAVAATVTLPEGYCKSDIIDKGTKWDTLWIKMSDGEFFEYEGVIDMQYLEETLDLKRCETVHIKGLDL